MTSLPVSGRFSDQAKGIAAMTLAALLLTLNDAVTKHLTETYSVSQVLAIRQSVAWLVILPYIHWVTGWAALRVANRPAMALRALFFIGTTFLIVSSFAVLPLTFVTAIAFSSPIFVVALSTMFLGEQVGPRRWLAVIAGFVGVLIIVRPAGADFALVVILPVLAALCAGLRDVVTRHLSRSDTSIAILFWSLLAVIAASAVTAAVDWQPVTPSAWGWLILVGILNAAAHFLIIDSLRLGDASLVSPFRYTSLVWAAIIGFLIWGEIPDGWTVLGAAIIVAGGIYIIERTPRKPPAGAA